MFMKFLWGKITYKIGREESMDMIEFQGLGMISGNNHDRLKVGDNKTPSIVIPGPIWIFLQATEMYGYVRLLGCRILIVPVEYIRFGLGIF
jgi:hypothetical protein